MISPANERIGDVVIDSSRIASSCPEPQETSTRRTREPEGTWGSRANG